MDLVRTWLRSVSTALGASLLVPLSLIVAGGLVAFGGGGFAGLGALDQLVEGPDPRGVERAADTLAAEPSTLLVSPPDAGGAPTGAGTTGGSPTTGGDGTAPRNEGGGDRDVDRDRDDVGGERPPGDGGGETGGGGTAGPQPPEQRGPLRELGDTTRGVTDQLPPAVGEPTGETIDQVVELGEQVLGPAGQPVAPRAAPEPGTPAEAPAALP